jgi:hypothetical protein
MAFTPIFRCCMPHALISNAIFKPAMLRYIPAGVFTAEELEDILTQAGFTLTFQRNGQEKGLAGDVEPFIMIAAHA